MWDDIEGVLWGILIATFVAVAIMLLIVPILMPLWTQQEVTITVAEKVPYHDGQYLIISEEGEVFTVSDELILFLFDASDRYASIKEEKTYRLKVCGMRFHLLSWYRNIIEIREVT